MKSIQLRLPDRIHGRMRRLAQEEGVSLNQFIVTSVSNEVIRQETSDFFRKAAAKFDPQAFADALSAVPDRAVPASDRVRTGK
ncbi:MAG: toxin-antitoxin system HicB family antitoxin [Kiritimatiellae bacterium]|nr:toxin-antitoxin system HicB family antitoxin [Kiritimatiellia bacterium]